MILFELPLLRNENGGNRSNTSSAAQSAICMYFQFPTNVPQIQNIPI
jgi:hypothetical protein